MVAPDIRYVPHVIADADRTLDRLVAEITWSDQMRARRTASFGVPYNYSGQTYPDVPMPPLVEDIARVAARFAGHAFNNCLVNLYETGKHRMGFHADSYVGLDPASSIAIVSLGATRALVFRSRVGAETTSCALEHGSLMLMNQATQEAWLHGVPPDPAAGRRISLTFRLICAR